MVKKAGRIGTLNQGPNVIWDNGAVFLWRPRFNTLVQGNGGSYDESGVEVTYTYSGTATSLGDWTAYDPGLGAFIEKALPPPNFLPFDGHFQAERLNTWNTSSDASSDRGPFTREAGLNLVLLTPPPSPHILQNTTGEPADVPTVSNASGSAKRMYRQETTSSGNKKMWSMLFQKGDGSQITSSDVTLGAATLADPLGADSWGRVDSI